MSDETPDRLIEALRARGAARDQPLRWARIEALQRRAAAHGGKTRRWLDQRLQQLLADCAQALGQAAPPPPPAPPAAAALSDLLRHLARQGVPVGAAAVGLRAVQQHRGTWARLQLQRQLAQALATVPEQAGPLNTQRLLHQALSQMQAAAPAYAQRFMAHVEALLWLDRSALAEPAARAQGPAPPRPRRPAAAARR